MKSTLFLLASLSIFAHSFPAFPSFDPSKFKNVVVTSSKSNSKSSRNSVVSSNTSSKRVESADGKVFEENLSNASNKTDGMDVVANMKSTDIQLENGTKVHESQKNGHGVQVEHVLEDVKKSKKMIDGDNVQEVKQESFLNSNKRAEDTINQNQTMIDDGHGNFHNSTNSHEVKKESGSLVNNTLNEERLKNKDGESLKRRETSINENKDRLADNTKNYSLTKDADGNQHKLNKVNYKKDNKRDSKHSSSDLEDIKKANGEREKRLKKKEKSSREAVKSDVLDYVDEEQNSDGTFNKLTVVVDKYQKDAADKNLEQELSEKVGQDGSIEKNAKSKLDESKEKSAYDERMVKHSRKNKDGSMLDVKNSTLDATSEGSRTNKEEELSFSKDSQGNSKSEHRLNKKNKKHNSAVSNGSSQQKRTGSDGSIAEIDLSRKNERNATSSDSLNLHHQLEENADGSKKKTENEVATKSETLNEDIENSIKTRNVDGKGNENNTLNMDKYTRDMNNKFESKVDTSLQVDKDGFQNVASKRINTTNNSDDENSRQQALINIKKADGTSKMMNNESSQSNSSKLNKVDKEQYALLTSKDKNSTSLETSSDFDENNEKKSAAMVDVFDVNRGGNRSIKHTDDRVKKSNAKGSAKSLSEFSKDSSGNEMRKDESSNVLKKDYLATDDKNVDRVFATDKHGAMYENVKSKIRHEKDSVESTHRKKEDSKSADGTVRKVDESSDKSKAAEKVSNEMREATLLQTGDGDMTQRVKEQKIVNNKLEQNEEEKKANLLKNKDGSLVEENKDRKLNLKEQQRLNEENQKTQEFINGNYLEQSSGKQQSQDYRDMSSSLNVDSKKVASDGKVDEEKIRQSNEEKKNDLEKKSHQEERMFNN